MAENNAYIAYYVPKDKETPPGVGFYEGKIVQYFPQEHTWRYDDGVISGVPISPGASGVLDAMLFYGKLLPPPEPQQFWRSAFSSPTRIELTYSGLNRDSGELALFVENILNARPDIKKLIRELLSVEAIEKGSKDIPDYRAKVNRVIEAWHDLTEGIRHE